MRAELEKQLKEILAMQVPGRLEIVPCKDFFAVSQPFVTVTVYAPSYVVGGYRQDPKLCHEHELEIGIFKERLGKQGPYIRFTEERQRIAHPNVWVNGMCCFTGTDPEMATLKDAVVYALKMLAYEKETWREDRFASVTGLGFVMKGERKGWFPTFDVASFIR